MKTKEEIKERLTTLIKRRDLLVEVYHETMAEIKNCPNQFENKEYQIVDKQIMLLSWILS
jgi:hypothetical protein